MNIPASLQYIGDKALDGTALSFTTYGNARYLGPAGNPYYFLINIVDKSATSFTAHSDCKVVNFYAFAECSELVTVDLENVEKIGGSAFLKCSKLTTVTMDSATSIGDYAFAECSSLTAINIPAPVDDIGNFVFDKCGSLATLTVDLGNAVYSASSNILMSKDGKNAFFDGLFLSDRGSPRSLVRRLQYACGIQYQSRYQKRADGV